LANRHERFDGEPTQRLRRNAVICQQPRLCIVADQCLSVRITLVRNTDSFRLS